MKSRRLLAGGVGLALLMLLSGCPSRNSSDGATTGPTSSVRAGAVTLRTATSTDVRTLDSALAYDTWSTAVVHALTRRLVDYDEEGRLVGDLAESWEVADDGLTYTFHLREAKYEDGSTIQAAHFKRALDRVRDPATASPGASFYGGIEKITTVDERTLRLVLSTPDPTLLNKLAMTFAAPYSPAGAEGKPLASGSYRLVARRPQELELARNPHDDQAGSMADTLILQLQVPEDLQMTRFRNGELDLLTGLSLADLALVKRDPVEAGRLVQAPVSQTWYFGMNITRPPFDHPKVRQAVLHAIDRERQVLLAGAGAEATGILPPELPGYRSEQKLPARDLAKAKALLAEAGYPQGLPKSLTATMWLATGELYERRAEAVQADLREAGIPVELRSGTMSEYLTAYKNADCWYGGWYPDFPDAGNFLEPLFHSRSITPRNSLNSTRYRNAEVDRLLDAAQATPLGPDRQTLYRQAEDLILADAPWAPLYFEVETRYYRPGVTGVRVHPVWRQKLTGISKSPG